MLFGRLEPGLCILFHPKEEYKMNKKNKACFKARGVLKQARLFFLVGIALTMTVPPIMAQTQPLTSARPQSLTSSATQGLWDNEVDRFMDVNDYDTVEFDKFYGLLQGGGYSTVRTINGGFAKNFGSIYLGLYFDGNLASGSSAESKDANGDWLGTAANDSGITFDNEVQVLIGTPVGGFKLALLMPGFRTDTDESTAATVKTREGQIGVSLTWGKNFALGGGLLKPELEVGYLFDQDKIETTPKPSGDTTTVSDDSSILIAGLRGTYEFAPGASSRSSLTLEDTINISFPTNPRRENTPSSGDSIETEGNKTENTLTGSFAKTYDINERFSAGWLVGLAFDISLDPVKQTTTTSGVTTTSDQETTTFRLTPGAGLGFTYKFIPDRFTLNGGVKASYTYEFKEWKDNEAAGTTRAEETTHTAGGTSSGTSNGWNVDTALGGTLYFNPKVFLDFRASVVAGSFSVDLSSFSLLVSVRN
jgi:hypothetical protein